MKANAITKEPFSNPEKRVYGTLYHLEGNVASPLQFMLTDSSSHFFRASLLFNTVPNQDSIAPVLIYIKEDVMRLIESFEW
jgi:gliding motility-associated lipoprotein GldD